MRINAILTWNTALVGAIYGSLSRQGPRYFSRQNRRRVNILLYSGFVGLEKMPEDVTLLIDNKTIHRRQRLRRFFRNFSGQGFCTFGWTTFEEHKEEIIVVLLKIVNVYLCVCLCTVGRIRTRALEPLCRQQWPSRNNIEIEINRNRDRNVGRRKYNIIRDTFFSTGIYRTLKTRMKQTDG